MRKSKQRARAFRNLRYNPKTFFSNSSIIRWILFILIVVGFYLLISSSLLRVSAIECTGMGNKACDESVVAELNKHIGELTFLINVVEIEGKIQKANPKYADLSVQAKLPNKIILNIGEKLAYANIRISSSSASLIIDNNLEVLDISLQEITGIMTIITPITGEIGIGDRIEDATTIQTIKIAEEINKSYIAIKNIKIISPTEIIARLFDGKIAIFSSTGDIPRQVTSLQLILSKATISPEPRIIDVRFDMPVLKY